MPKSRFGTSGALAGAALLSVVLSAAARADEPTLTLVPHHASYKLTLVKATGGKAPAAASGLISYEFSGLTCDGYKTVFRQITEVEPAEGESRVSDMQSTTGEAGDATRFSFDIHTTYNQDREDDVGGHASKVNGGDIDVDLDHPLAEKADLKTTALFPTEHLKAILESAEAGKKILAVSVYDGSETGKKIFNTLSVIGAPITLGAPEQAAQQDGLRNLRRWPVTISYFEQGQGDAQPNYVLSFELYENGISRALKVDYGDFTLAGELVDLKIDAARPCSK